jgi:hypothetical protein
VAWLQQQAALGMLHGVCGPHTWYGMVRTGTHRVNGTHVYARVRTCTHVYARVCRCRHSH